MKRTFTLLCLSLASLASFAQQTYVPDDAFEQRLIDLHFDDVLDDYVLTDSINFRTYLWISDRGITDLTGIEDFVSLSTLWAKGNSITTADLSSLSKLKNLYLNSNELETVILNPNAPLEKYWCSGNKLTEVDISPFDELIHFYCGTNSLTSLDMRNGANTQLVEYGFGNNPDLYCVEVDNVAYSSTNWSGDFDPQVVFTTDCSEGLTYVPDDAFEQRLIDVGFDNGILDNYVPTANISSRTYLWIADKGIEDLTGIEDFVSLSTLWAKGNDITTADLSSLSKLKNLYLNSNELETVILNPNAPLEKYWCSGNKLTEVDISPFDELIHFYCGTNSLTSLDMRNGANTQLVKYDFNNNPDLTCASVDDPAYSTANWSAEVDAHLMFSADCSIGQTYVPDDAFEQALIDLQLDDVLDDYVLTDNISGVTRLSVSEKGIQSLEGIQDFQELWLLWVPNNELKGVLDLSSNLNLRDVLCYNNELTGLNFGLNQELRYLNCGSNEFSELDMSGHSKLEILVIQDNQMTNVKLDNCFSLEIIWCSNTPLSELNLSDSPALEALYLESTNVSELDLSNNVNLEDLWCVENDNLTSINLKNGNNDKLLDDQLFFIDNPNLSCVEVDDAAYSTTNWTEVDAHTTFSEDCSSSPREGVELSKDIAVTVVPNMVTDYMRVTLEEASANYDLYDMNGSKVASGELLEGSNELDLSDLSSGAYILKVYTSSSVLEERIIKL